MEKTNSIYPFHQHHNFIKFLYARSPQFGWFGFRSQGPENILTRADGTPADEDGIKWCPGSREKDRQYKGAVNWNGSNGPCMNLEPVWGTYHAVCVFYGEEDSPDTSLSPEEAACNQEPNKKWYSDISQCLTTLEYIQYNNNVDIVYRHGTYKSWEKNNLGVWQHISQETMRYEDATRYCEYMAANEGDVYLAMPEKVDGPNPYVEMQNFIAFLWKRSPAFGWFGFRKQGRQNVLTGADGIVADEDDITWCPWARDQTPEHQGMVNWNGPNGQCMNLQTLSGGYHTVCAYYGNE